MDFMEKRLIKKVERLLKLNTKNQVKPLTLGCFYDIGYDIAKCRSEDYNPKIGTGKCCPYYEYKCKCILEALLKEEETLNVLF